MQRVHPPALCQSRCYCDGNTEGMSKAVEEAGQKITELKSKLEAEKAEKAQLDQELVQHKLDRESASSLAESPTWIRSNSMPSQVCSRALKLVYMLKRSFGALCEQSKSGNRQYRTPVQMPRELSFLISRFFSLVCVRFFKRC